MRWSLYRWSCLLEAAAFAGFVGWFIWQLQFTAPWTWRVMLVWLVGSFLARRDTPKTMGWRADNLWRAAKRAASFFGVSSLLICATGLFLGMLHRLPLHLIEPRRFGSYLAFCLLQQVALNSFLMNRLLGAFGEQGGNHPHPSQTAERGGRPGIAAAVLAGLVFGALHWPNPVLVPLTSVGGAAMAWLFARERNILPLALGQAVLGALVWWAFPAGWHHSMRVGPGFALYGK